MYAHIITTINNFIMKAKILMLVTAFLVLGFSACQKQETPTTPESVAVITQPQPAGESAEAGKRAVTIAATAAWTATSNSAWLTVSPASGEKGMQEVILSFQENTSTEARTAVVTFTSGTYSETFTLVQNGAPVSGE